MATAKEEMAAHAPRRAAPRRQPQVAADARNSAFAEHAERKATAPRARRRATRSAQAGAFLSSLAACAFKPTVAAAIAAAAERISVRILCGVRRALAQFAFEIARRSFFSVSLRARERAAARRSTCAARRAREQNVRCGCRGDLRQQKLDIFCSKLRLFSSSVRAGARSDNAAVRLLDHCGQLRARVRLHFSLGASFHCAPSTISFFFSFRLPHR